MSDDCCNKCNSHAPSQVEKLAVDISLSAALSVTLYIAPCIAKQF